MFSIFILVGIYVIHCTTAGCIQISSADFAPLLFASKVELVFEILGVIKIYFQKK